MLESDEQTGVCLPTLANEFHFVSLQTVLCCYWWLCGSRCLTVALWSGLVGTKLWCQWGEATLVPVCSVISQTNPAASARNALSSNPCPAWPPCCIGPLLQLTPSCQLPWTFTMVFAKSQVFHRIFKCQLWQLPAEIILPWKSQAASDVIANQDVWNICLPQCVDIFDVSLKNKYCVHSPNTNLPNSTYHS